MTDDTRTYYRDYDEGYDVPARRSSNWWLSLLLIPLFFFLGWVANDFSTNRFSNGVDSGVGVGGAPFVSPTGMQDNTFMSPIPSEMMEPSITPEVSVRPMMDDNL